MEWAAGRAAAVSLRMIINGMGRQWSRGLDLQLRPDPDRDLPPSPARVVPG